MRSIEVSCAANKSSDKAKTYDPFNCLHTTSMFFLAAWIQENIPYQSISYKITEKNNINTKAVNFHFPRPPDLFLFSHLSCPPGGSGRRPGSGPPNSPAPAAAVPMAPAPQRRRPGPRCPRPKLTDAGHLPNDDLAVDRTGCGCFFFGCVLKYAYVLNCFNVFFVVGYGPV